MTAVHLLIETGRASRVAACDTPGANHEPGAETLAEVTCRACLTLFGAPVTTDVDLCHAFIETGECEHTDAEHDALADAHRAPAPFHALAVSRTRTDPDDAQRAARLQRRGAPVEVHYVGPTDGLRDLAGLYAGTPEEVADRMAGLAQRIADGAPGWHAHGAELHADDACLVCDVETLAALTEHAPSVGPDLAPSDWPVPTAAEEAAHFHGCPDPTGRPYDCDWCQSRAASMAQ